jgi:VanZ family protein
LLHLLIYFFLGFLFSRSFRTDKEKSVFSRVVLISLMVITYGVLDEIHQMAVPGRDASVGDVIADGIGGVIAGVLFRKG